MFYWRKPSPEQIQVHLAQQAALPFSYAAVGQTKQTPPRGYVVDHNRVQLGTGGATFEQAKKPSSSGRCLTWVGCKFAGPMPPWQAARQLVYSQRCAISGH